MDKNQHLTQDAAEPYAVFVMAQHAQKLGILGKQDPSNLWEEFKSYLDKIGWDESEFVSFYPKYKTNVDAQVPNFINRLAQRNPAAKFTFKLDEVEQRKAGNKADFAIYGSDVRHPLMVSLKNYIGAGGISRPQVSSGTFLSFANGFVFERKGVGTYLYPNDPNQSFKGSNKNQRDQGLHQLGLTELAKSLDELEELQQLVRSELLSLRIYDKSRIRQVIENIVPKAQKAMLEVFRVLGPDQVKSKFLERANLKGSEHVLYFDGKNSVDSITSTKFARLYAMLNSEDTELNVIAKGQSLAFDLVNGDELILSNLVPLTINTNGAWHRPNVKYSGKQAKMDKGHLVHLEYGEIRPKKSKEIATSTNLYMDLGRANVFN